jgi:hypothetical protein
MPNWSTGTNNLASHLGIYVDTQSSTFVLSGQSSTFVLSGQSSASLRIIFSAHLLTTKRARNMVLPPSMALIEQLKQLGGQAQLGERSQVVVEGSGLKA